MVKILLVEDDKSLREIYGVRLLAEGYDIVSAGDGEEALAMAIKDRPDLIVSDVMMPKISGFDMLDILRSTTETKGIKVIMMTALSSEEQRQRGVALGADRYLVKSQVGIEDVVRTVHEVLGDAPVTSSSSQPAPAPVAIPTPTPVSTPVTPVTPAPTPVAPATPAPTPVPVATPAPVSPAPTTAPVAPAPAAPSIVGPLATSAAPATPAPAPVSAPQPSTLPQPTSPASAATATPEPVLPQPTAPFSTPRTTGNTLADRVIQPLNDIGDGPDFKGMMDKELGQTPAADTPASMNYEETPRPAGATPSLPTPPTPPETGLL